MMFRVVLFMVFLFGGLCEATVHIQTDIINDIGPNVQLGLHCKSKDKDLGPQSLAYHQHYGFREPINFLVTTLFFCHFEWGNQSKWFDILVAVRDRNTCEDRPCIWSIRPSGPCRLTGQEVCYPWH